MSYVQYNRPFSAVGFRPYRKLTPFAAAHGLAGLGDDSSTMAQLGFSTAQISEITQAHTSGALSDNGYTFLLQGGVPVDQLDSFLAQDPGAPDNPNPGASQPSPTVQAGVPNGSTLLYTASIGAHLFGSGGINDFLSAIAGALTSQGIQVVGSNSSSAGVTVFNIQLQLLITGSGYGKPQDVQAVVDHAIYVNRNAMPLSSSIAVTGLPGSSSQSVGLPTASSFTTWIERNATWLLLGIGAIVILPKVLK